MSTNFNANTYLIIFFSFLALLLKGCSDQDTPDSDLGQHKGAVGKYFYAGKEQASRPFDERTGALKSGISLLDLSKEPFVLGVLKGATSKVIADAQLPNNPVDFIIDGYHAVKLSGNHVFDGLEVADSYVDLSGQCRIGSLDIGTLPFSRGLLHKDKPLEGSVAASVSLEGDGPFVVGTFTVAQSSFLDIKKGMTVSNDWRTRVPSHQGLIIDKPVKDGFTSVVLEEATLKAPQILIFKGSSFSIRRSTMACSKLAVSDGGVIKISEKSTLQGFFRILKDGFLLFEQSGEYQDGVLKGLGIGSLVVDHPVLVDATISIRSSWSPGDEAEKSSKYQKLFKKQPELVLLKAKELNGRASLQSQYEAMKALGDSSLRTSYFEKFVKDANKKLALQHDYNAQTITLKLVDADTKLDKDGCLPDIGAYKHDAYKKLLEL